MPPLSRLMLRAALIWQGLGFLAGALMLLAKVGMAPGQLLALSDAHIHMLLGGWLVQLAAGVAYWILPRLDAAGARGDRRPVVAGALSLNLAVGLALAAGVGRCFGLALPALAILSGGLYAAGFLLLAAHCWTRVLPFRALPRPEREPKATSLQEIGK